MQRLFSPAMKRTFTAILILIAISSVHSQSKSAFKLNFGYCMPAVKSNLGSSYNSTSTSYSDKGVYGSFGKGFQIETGYEYEFVKSLSAQLEATYLIGSEITTDENYDIGSHEKRSLGARFLIIAPSLKFSTSFNHFKLYGGLGPAIGFGKMKGKYVYHGTNDVVQEYVLKGSTPLGIKAMLGVEKSTGSFSWYFQTSVLGMNYGPSEGELTKYDVNGQDQLKSYTADQKKIKFVESQNSSSSNSSPTALKQYYPLSYINLTIGLLYRFGGNGSTAPQ
jgi:hypothetical protein